MFEHASIYNPDFGTEENVEPQLIASWRAEGVELTKQELIRILGVAQGIAELAYSFGETPVKWFKTGTGQHAKLVSVIRLVSTHTENWRSGFWFVGQSPSPKGSRAWSNPSIINYVVSEAFVQHQLVNGGIPEDPATMEYWKPFVPYINSILASKEAIAMFAIVPKALRMAPGMLDPSTAQAIEQSRQESHVSDVMIVTMDDLAAVYAGQHLNLSTRRAIQRWLAEKIKQGSKNTKGVPQKDIQVLRSQNNASQNETFKNETPQNEATQNVTSQSETNSTPIGNEMPNNEPHNTPPPTETGTEQSPDPSQEPESEAPVAKGWFSLPDISLSTFSIPSMSMPAMRSISSIPGMSSMPSVSIPSMPAMTMPSIPSMKMVSNTLSTSWWSGNEENEVVGDGYLISNAAIYNSETKKRLSVSAWRQALYVYISIDEISDDTEDNSKDKEKVSTRLFESSALYMEGFSFAFVPPTRFYYMVYDPRHEKLVTTFPLAEAGMDALGSSMDFDKVEEDQRVVRSGSTWLYYTSLSNGVKAVFGKKKSSSSQPSSSLSGVFQSDSQKWLENYIERGTLSQP